MKNYMNQEKRNYHFDEEQLAKEVFESDIESELKSKKACSKKYFERNYEDISNRLKKTENKDRNKSGSYRRPEVCKGHCDGSIDLSFQQLESEEYNCDDETVVKFFGITEIGNSVLCNVTGFLNHFFVRMPSELRKQEVQLFLEYLQDHFEGVKKINVTMKESIWGFNNSLKTPFLQIFVSNRHISKVKIAFERGEVVYENIYFEKQIFDSMSFLLRFLTSCNISGMTWITLPKNKYLVVEELKKESTCQIECYIDYRDIIPHLPDEKWLKIAPLRILSFDIECAGRKGIFPTPDQDSVIQIANVVKIFGSSKTFIKNVFVLNTCSPIIGAEIFEFQSEKDLLMGWKDFVINSDPDLIIGYNTTNFDIPYLINRSKALDLSNFPYFGKLKRAKQEIKNTFFSSKAYGVKENKNVVIDGRLQFDLLQYFQREYKLRSYSLNSVSSHFLGEQKENVHHSIINTLQNGDCETRRRLAVYCLKDAHLPMILLEKLMCVVTYTELARVVGVPFSYLLTRGQQIKVITQLFKKCYEQDILIPNLKASGNNDEYEGATVIEPERGYYDYPIATLDFNSLYPSIMIAHNLCYCTLTDLKSIKKFNLTKDDYIITPNNDYFVKDHIKKGILASILHDLLKTRKIAKDMLQKETDPFTKEVLNARQLALKISANSVYGFTGATIGKLPCLAISSSVTSYGRKMIDETKILIEEYFSKKNNFPFDSKVIYGDTDSVMVNFYTKDIEQTMDLGKKASEYVSKTFIHPIKLDFEKIYYPFLLINKKRYAGLYWTNSKHHDKMDTKGIETVRRDNCRLVQNVISKVLIHILEEMNCEKAQRFVRQTIADLLQNRIDLSQLVITKLYSKQDYVSKQPHIELANKMNIRNPGSGPALGDRIAYVIVQTTNSDKNYNKSEDPLYVLDHSIPIDVKYYLENQLSKPLERIFTPILGESKTKELLSGSHTRTIKVLSTKQGGLFKFTVKSDLCKSCKVPLPSSVNLALCVNCLKDDKGLDLYCDSLSQMNYLENKFSRLWTECQRCQGSLFQQIICSNNDCPIFYMRKKIQKDINQHKLEIKRWNETDW